MNIVADMDSTESALADYDVRLVWAKEHARILTALFASKPVKEIDQRIWRTTFFRADCLHVATLWQNVNVIAPNPTTPVPTAQVYLARGFSEIGPNVDPFLKLRLAGPYSMLEVVAFLELDKLDPAQVEWVDETRYSDVLVVRDIFKGVQRND